MFPCVKCHYKARRYKDLLFHYQFIHSHENGFSITCSVDGCQKSYRLVHSLTKHIRRKHCVFSSQHLSRQNEAKKNPEIFDCLHEVTEESDDETPLDCDTSNNKIDIIEPQFDFCKQLALFLVTLREKCKLPANAVSTVVEEISNLIQLHQAEVTQRVVNVMKENNVDDVLSNVIKTSVLQDSGIETACNSLNTAYRLNQYIDTKMHMVKPVEYVLGEGRQGKSRSMEYVPILESLQMMLIHDDVFSYVVNSHRSNDGILRDICDGTKCTENLLFRNDPTAIQILLFFDEFTVTNPIGHSVRQYKIGGFYMLLANIPPKYRSHLNSIQLVALAKSVDIKEFGYSMVLAPFIHDLKILESEGVCIKRPEGNVTLRGSIISVIGDNLGAQSFGGFVESFITFRYCRFCFLPKNEMQKTTDCSNLPMRTIAMYKQQVELVKNDVNLSSVYGIKCDSVLNELDFFHVVGGMPSDIAHDLFEGVVPFVLKLTIEYFVKRQFFTLDFLNEQISDFSYSDFDKSNKPGPVPKVLAKFKISQTASQSWCFIRLISLMIGDSIPIDDPKWEIILSLQDLIFCICAPAIRRYEVQLMKDFVEDFLERFCQEFPEENLKPKFHFLLHYPDEMLHFGPLLHMQTLRFEAKHSYFKELAQRTKCRKNICKSLATRHQNLQCISSESRDFLKGSAMETVGGQTIPLVLLQNRVQLLLQPYVQDVTTIFQCKSVVYNSVKYSIGSCFIEGHDGNNYVFSKIVQCFLVKGIVLVLCKKLNYVNYRRHLNAHIVRETDEFTLTDLRNVSQQCTIGLYKTDTMFKFVITCESRTKKCTADGSSTIEDINGEIRTKFSLASRKFYIQYFDKEVEEFIDLDSTEDLIQDEFVKLRVILEDFGESPSSRLSSVSPTPSVDNLSSSRCSTPFQEAQASGSSAPTGSSAVQLQDKDPELPQLSTPKRVASTSARATQLFTDNKRKTKQWPKQYVFPTYTVPVSTVMKLENNQTLSSKDRRDILTGIYQDVTSYEGGLYPTSERYDAIIDGIFRQYPNITMHEGLTLENSRDLWKDRLKVKFQNSRRRVDGNLPEIVLKKKKKLQSEELPESSVSTTWGLKNYLPASLESEDDQTFESHVSWMQRELRKKDQRDEDGVNMRMALTLPKRRKMVVEEKKGIEATLSVFPWLGSVKQLIKEFHRLGPALKNPDVMASFEENLEKYGSAISNLAKNRKAAAFAIEISKRASNFRGEIERRHVENCSTILYLPCLFRENLTDIVKSNEAYQACEESLNVVICYEKDILDMSGESFKLLIEDVTLFKSSNLIESVVGLMMAIYAFNLAYPKEVEKTLLLFQRVFLGLDDESPIDKKILNVMAQINQTM